MKNAQQKHKQKIVEKIPTRRLRKLRENQEREQLSLKKIQMLIMLERKLLLNKH